MFAVLAPGKGQQSVILSAANKARTEHQGGDAVQHGADELPKALAAASRISPVKCSKGPSTFQALETMPQAAVPLDPLVENNTLVGISSNWWMLSIHTTDLKRKKPIKGRLASTETVAVKGTAKELHQCK